jgi:hypothetical protein
MAGNEAIACCSDDGSPLPLPLPADSRNARAGGRSDEAEAAREDGAARLAPCGSGVCRWDGMDWIVLLDVSMGSKAGMDGDGGQHKQARGRLARLGLSCLACVGSHLLGHAQCPVHGSQQQCSLGRSEVKWSGVMEGRRKGTPLLSYARPNSACPIRCRSGGRVVTSSIPTLA